MQPRRSLRLSQGRNDELSGTHDSQADIAKTAQATRSGPGKLETSPDFLEHYGHTTNLKLPRSISAPRSYPWDTISTGGFDTENFITGDIEGTVRSHSISASPPNRTIRITSV